MLLYQILGSTTHGKIQKCHTKTKNLKYQVQRGMKNWNYLMDKFLYQIFKIILTLSSKKHEIVTNNSTIRMYVNKIQNKIIFKFKAGYYLEL